MAAMDTASEMGEPVANAAPDGGGELKESSGAPPGGAQQQPGPGPAKTGHFQSNRALYFLVTPIVVLTALGLGFLLSALNQSHRTISSLSTRLVSLEEELRARSVATEKAVESPPLPPEPLNPSAAPANAGAASGPGSAAGWTKACSLVEGVETCRTGGMLAEASGAVVLEFALVERGAAKELQIAVPSPALIGPGVTVSVGSSAPINASFAVCMSKGCAGRAQVDADFVASLMDQKGRKLDFDMSLEGFAAAYDGPASASADTAGK
jgi:invasion protein IalB